jgi:hypothetical protein
MHMQKDVGPSNQVLSSSYHMYGPLATDALLKCIWAETETYGLTLCCCSNLMWCH